MNQPYAPADIDIVELPKMAEAIDWLIGFVNRKLAEGSFYLAKGMEYHVHFGHDDFVHSYGYLVYWRDQYCDIASLFREQGWEVREFEKAFPQMRSGEVQPALGFKVAAND